MMINLTKPKYIMPVTGEYRKQFTVREIAKSMGYKEEDVFLLDNGDLLHLIMVNQSRKKIDIVMEIS